MEVRNPASAPSTSKTKAPGKKSNSKKGKKKVTVGASGIEDVAGSLNPTAESGPVTHSLTGGGKEDTMEQDGDGDGDGDDMYASDEDGEVDGTLEENVGGEGGIGADTSADLPPRKKRRSARNDKGKTATRSTRSPTAGVTPTTVAEPNVAQNQHQQGPPSTGNNISIPIDPVLETLQVQASGSGGI